MGKEVISDKQGIAMVVLFIIGSGSVTVPGLEAKQDVWISAIIAIIIALPMILIYARLQYIFPNKDLYDIIYICFGNFFGNTIIIIFILHLIAIQGTIIRHHTEFAVIVGLQETPVVIFMVLFTIVIAYVTKGGIEVLARWGKFFFPMVLLLTIVMLSLFIPDIKINNIQPIMANGIKPILLGTFKILIFPFSQVVVFSSVISNFKEKRSPYKIYLFGFLIGAAIMLVTSFNVITVLGVNNAGSKYFSTHAAVSRINIANIQRIEVLSSILFFLGGFVKMGVHSLAICIGISKIVKCPEYRFLVIPISALLLNITYLTWNGTMDFFEFDRDVMPYVSFVNRIILPIVIYIFAEVKKKKITLKI